MAFTSSLVKDGVFGDLKYAIFTWTAAAVTSGSIVTGLSTILFTRLTNKTVTRGVIDDTTTAGTVALSGVTASDTGYILVLGY